jgi:hypothetical protein
VDEGKLYAPGLGPLAVQEDLLYAGQNQLAGGPSLSGSLFFELPVHLSRDIDGGTNGCGFHDVIMAELP